MIKSDKIQKSLLMDKATFESFDKLYPDSYKVFLKRCIYLATVSFDFYNSVIHNEVFNDPSTFIKYV